MSDPINEMFPSGGGMRGGPALVCVTYDSNGNPCGISGLPDFAENHVEALAAERDRLASENERLRDALRKISTAAPRIDIDPLDFLREFVRPTARAALKGDSHE